MSANNQAIADAIHAVMEEQLSRFAEVERMKKRAREAREERAALAARATNAATADASAPDETPSDEASPKRLCTCESQPKPDLVTRSLTSVLETVESLETAGHLNVEAQRQIAAKLKDVHNAVERKRAKIATKIILKLATECAFILAPMCGADVEGVDLFSDKFVTRLMARRLKLDKDNGKSSIDSQWLGELFDFYLRKPDDNDKDDNEREMQRDMVTTLLAYAPVEVDLWPEMEAYFERENYTSGMLKNPDTGDEEIDEGQLEEFRHWQTELIEVEPATIGWLVPASDTGEYAEWLRAQAHKQA